MDVFERKLQRLCISEDHHERNALAIELLDASLVDAAKASHLLPALFKTIASRAFRQVGTLVWCASHIDCSEYKAELNQIVLNGGFEASETAQQIIENQNLHPRP
ncbi:hypothetical protein [Asticcacaulis sp. W401b]|uniref:hypothetical protein n=1 Tax=Asticcacaulis sp. W401b TaxID=3388666 RepID=UPI0039704E28